MSAEYRILQTVKGLENAVGEFNSCVADFNSCNPEPLNRMKVKATCRADDTEGSGEFFELVCINTNTAEANTEEIYEIRANW